jgi:hypothetical protein
MNNTETSISPTLKSFKDYYLGTIFRPHKTFEALMTDSRRLKSGLIALLINAFLYTLVGVYCLSIHLRELQPLRENLAQTQYRSISL